MKMNTSTVKKLKVITLVEDTCPKRPFLGEHGLSFWIEVDDKKIMFDTGLSGRVLIHNLEALGLDLKSIDAFVLSHPHNDHSGGLRLIANQIKDVPMYCVSNAFVEYMPDRERISKLMSKINYVQKDTEIFSGVWIPKERATVNTPKVTKEINLVINLEGKGLVIITGCAHHGFSNLIDDAKTLFQHKLPVYALLGGFHLKDTGEKEIIKIVNSLKKSGLKILAPNHCTGFRALKIMAERFPTEMKLVRNTDTGTFHTGKMINLNL